MWQWLLRAFSWLGVSTLFLFVAAAFLFLTAQAFPSPLVQQLGLTTGNLTLLGVALLAFSFVPIFLQERNDRHKEFSDLMKLVHSRERVSVSAGTEQTFQDALKFVRASTHKIEVVVTGGPKAPKLWLSAVRQHMLDSKSKGIPILFDVLVLATPEDAKNAAFVTANRERVAAFKSDGLDIRVRVLPSGTFLGFDVLIADARHVSVGVSPEAPNSRSMSINLENHVDVGNAFSTWFEHLSRGAVDILAV